MKRFLLILLIYLITPSLLNSQDYEKKYITVIPGEHYAASGFYEFWFGAHWRDIWTTPVKVEILNLKTFAGGLTPVRKGGGMQTKSLQFKGNDGRIWKFRSVDKDPSRVLSEELRESIAEDIIKDQISTANPYAALVTAPLLNEVGVFQAVPKLFFLPDDELLGEYREEFGNLLGYIEEHPSTGDDEKYAFNNALDVKGTYKLFDHLAKKRNQKIDSEEFLKARLLDLIIGDWDRHMDQWRWAKFEQTDGDENLKVWKPIPRDRDQAFSKYDGIFPTIASYIIPQLNHFGEDYPQIEDLTWNGRFLDRRILTEMSRTTWDSITAFVMAVISDEAIDSAVKMLPPEVYALCADEIAFKLKSRRDNLHWASDQFYNLVNKYADVFCSYEDDYVEVNRLDNTFTIVTIYRRDKSTGAGKGEPLFYKIFDNDITIDLRIHLNDGDDKAYVFGECSESPIIRIIGGKGMDEFVDKSIVYGNFLTVTPFNAVQRRTYFYDSGKSTKLIEGPGTVYDSSEWTEPESELEKYEPQLRDRGHDWLPLPIFDLNTDYGLTIGAGVQLNRYNFRMIPQEYMQQVTLSYATRFHNFAAAYEGNFYSVVRDGRLNLIVAATEQFVTRYFGYGNETTYNSDLEKSDYYETNQTLITIFPTLHYSLSEIITGSAGISFINTNTSLNNDTLLSDFKYGNYGLGTLKPFGIHLALKIDKTDHSEYPLNGFRLNFYGKIFPAVFDVPEVFYQAGFDVRTYLTSEYISFATMGLRAGGSKMFGKFPFFAGAAVGGENNLRGYNDRRFSGEAALFGQAELRLFVTPINIILKSKVGINLFAETGRVFIENESSDKWHPSYGVGLWVAYLNSTLIGSSSVAFSPERTTFYLGLGMGF